MSRKPSNLSPANAQPLTAPAITRGFVCGMLNEETGTVEVVEFGDFTEDKQRVGFHYQTGSLRFEGFVADVAGLKLYALTRSLAAAGAAYRRARSAPRSPVPAWCRNHADLVAANCD